MGEGGGKGEERERGERVTGNREPGGSWVKTRIKGMIEVGEWWMKESLTRRRAVRVNCRRG